MRNGIAVIGHPSRLGGADTELDHQIRCWLAMGIDVHICHTGPLDENTKSMGLEERGCIYYAPCDWPSLEGLHCISFCNSEFLNHLPEIHRHVRSTTFVNCMSWNFEKELECQEKGLIDFHLYQARHSFDRVSCGCSYGRGSSHIWAALLDFASCCFQFGGRRAISVGRSSHVEKNRAYGPKTHPRGEKGAREGDILLY